MSTEKLSRFWLPVTVLLIVLIITTGVIIRSRQDKGQSLTITSPQTSQFQGEITIDGAVSNPGIYPLNSTDSIEGLLQATGGVTQNADLSQMRLYIPHEGENASPQKIDINRAEAWLLQALPDIGEVRAKAIIDYRQQNGPFRNIEELTRVPGISSSTFEKIKDFITVAE